MLIELTAEELELLCNALDSHRYWQLSEPQYRNSGDIIEPGTDDADDAAEIKAADALEDRLREAARHRARLDQTLNES